MATSYANTFSITCPDITNIRLSDMNITSGQPFTSWSVNHSGTTWTITVNCGRSGSASIAQNYVQLAKGQYHMFVYPTYSGTAGTYSNVPPNMNFYFSAEIDFSGHSGTYYLGQDGLDLINFWWIGGPLILNTSPYESPLAYVETPLGLYQASFLNQNVYQIGLTPAV